MIVSRKTVLWTLVLGFALLALPCLAEKHVLPELDENANIDDYLEYAALNNPGLEAAFLNWQAALEAADAAGTLPDPRLSYGFFIREVETRVGPQRQRVGVAQRFPWIGTLQLRRDRAAKTAEARRLDYEALKLDLFGRVKRAYHEYGYLARAIEITGENVQLLTFFERVARARYKVGSANHADIIKAQVELGRLEDELVSLRDRLRPAAARLNGELNRAVKAELPLPGPLDDGPVDIDEEALFTAIEQAPRLLAIDQAARREELTAELARLKRYPDFSVSLDYIETGDALDPTMPESGKDPVMAMVSLNIPLWRKASFAAQREALHRSQAAKLMRLEEENKLEVELEEALFGFRDAQRKIDLYGDSLLPKARQSLEVTQKAYSTEKAGFIDLIEAQRTLIRFRLARQRALADRAVKLAEIEEITGGAMALPTEME
jgi:outer membrane protein TolC